MKAFLARIRNRAFAPVDIASLVFLRITFGLLMVWEVCRYFRNDSIYHFWLEPRFLFKYYGFSWIHPGPGHWLYIHRAALGVLGLFVAVGFLYRIRVQARIFVSINGRKPVLYIDPMNIAAIIRRKLIRFGRWHCGCF